MLRMAPMLGLGRGGAIWSVPSRDATGWRIAGTLQSALVRLLPFLLARVYLDRRVSQTRHRRRA